MIKKLDFPLVLLALAAFLTPLIGGQVSTDALGLSASANPLIIAILGGLETPTLSHAFLAALCSSALIVMLLQRKIVQVPNNTVSGLVMVLLALITLSIGYSSFRSASIPAAIEWVSYGIAFYAVVAIAGRQRGPIVILTSLFVGCVLLALLGIREFGQMKAVDPTHRIFPQWIGPNALAAMLLVGFFAGLGLAANSDRLKTLGYGLGCTAIAIAITLTQSKGAFLALIVCAIVFVLLSALWLSGTARRKAIVTVFASVSILVVMIFAIAHLPTGSPNSKAGSAVSRLTDASTSTDQSVGFRKLLWTSSVKLIKANPLGSGVGTFQYESAKPGLVTQTRFAHQTYLQLAVEASPLALILFIGAFVWWLRILSKGAKNLESDQNITRLSVATAVLAVLIHSFIDSDFSYFGVGISVFMLLGLGLLLSTDGVAPEYLQPVLRRLAAAGIACITLLFGLLGVTEAWRAQARDAAMHGNYNDAQNKLEAVRNIAPWDAEAWSLSMQTTRSAADQMTFAKQAASLAPSPHNLRMLAHVQEQAGMNSEAISTLKRVFAVDPNNLRAMANLSKLQTKLGLDEDARTTLRKIVDLEKTDFFKVRSLPELIETETYDARVQLAQMTQDKVAQIDLLKPAVEGFKEYAAKTVPNVIRFATAPEGAMDFGGERQATAIEKMKEGKSAAAQLEKLYRVVGKEADAVACDKDAALFGKALEDLSFK